jgi:hypothetical protein
MLRSFHTTMRTMLVSLSPGNRDVYKWQLADIYVHGNKPFVLYDPLERNSKRTQTQQHNSPLRLTASTCMTEPHECSGFCSSQRRGTFINPLKTIGKLYVPPAFTVRNSAFCPCSYHSHCKQRLLP